MSSKTIGAEAARNVAIREARGRYIANLDADDFWSVGHLLNSVRVLEGPGNPILVGCQGRLVDATGADLKRRRNPVSRGFRTRLVFLNQVGHSSAVFRRDAAM